MLCKTTSFILCLSVLHQVYAAGVTCGYDTVATSGVIQSPGFPSSYSENTDCVWNITVPDGQLVNLHFTELDVESSAGCLYDYVEVKELSVKNSSRRYCSSALPPSFISSSKNILVIFHSDSSVGGNGFQAVFVAVSRRSKNQQRPFDCPLANAAAVVAEGDSSVEVEVTKGFYVSLYPGVYRLTDSVVAACSATITVLSNKTCPDSVTTVADGSSESSFFPPLAQGLAYYNLTLPQGDYQYTYELNSKTCQTSFNVVDEDLLKRLVFVANYSIPCKQYDDMSAEIRAIADHRYDEIAEFCDGNCTKPLESSSGISIQCFNDTVTIMWPTVRFFPGFIDDIPDDFHQLMVPKLRRRTALDMIIFTKVPSVVYPTVDDGGLAVTWRLLPACKNGQRFNAQTSTCGTLF